LIADLSIVVPTFNERANIPALIERIATVLEGVSWEIIVVDDDSPDDTAAVVKAIAQHDPRIRCIRRVNRRGLSGACVEGILSSSAPLVAVIDADLQHDEAVLPLMYASMRSGAADIAIASRYIDATSVTSGLSRLRAQISRCGTALAKRAFGIKCTDPMSGFFMLRRNFFDPLAPQLAESGYKILADILASSRRPPRIAEFGFEFRARRAGQSKFDMRVALDFLGLVINKATAGLIPARFAAFAIVGGVGVIVHLAALQIAHAALATPHSYQRDLFAASQTTATLVAMTTNFFINNAVTYRDLRIRGLSHLLRGLFIFYLICALGAIANISVATSLYDMSGRWLLPATAGIVMGSIWNFVLSSFFVWKRT